MAKGCAAVGSKGSVLQKMADMLECWDSLLGRHCRLTGFYVEKLVGKMQKDGIYGDILTPSYAECLKKGAYFYGIGRLMAPPAETGNRMDAFETERQIRWFADAGESLIRENMKYLSDRLLAEVIWEMAAYRYEKWDGTGYPKGLKGEEIPLAARILSVAASAAGLQKARDRSMENERGKSFDAKILDAFFSLAEDGTAEGTDDTAV